MTDAYSAVMVVEQVPAPKAPPSFRRHVFTIVVIAGACVGAFIALFATHLWSARSQSLASAQQRAATLTRFAEDHAFRSLQSVESTAARVVERASGPPSERDLREAVVDSTLIREIALLGADATIAASSETQSAGRRWEDDALLAEAASRPGSLVLGTPRAGRRLGETTPVPGSQRHLLPAAYVAADRSVTLLIAINPEYFVSLYDAILSEQQGVVRLLTFGGGLIAASRGESSAPGASYSSRAPFSDSLSRREHGSFIEAAPDGDVLLSAYRATRIYPAVVTIGLSRQAALSDWRADALLFGGVLAAITVAFTAGAVLMVRQSRERELQQRRIAASERAARATEARLIDAIESMSEGFALFDAGDRLRVWNRQYVDCFPYLGPLLRPGLPFRELVSTAAAHARLGPEESSSWTDWRLAQHANPGPAFEQQLNDGRVALTVERRTAEGGTVLVVRDVTDARRAERSLRQAQTDAEQANRAKSDFVAMISHEIRTPMNAVMGFAELLRDGPLDAQQRRHADAIVESATRLLHLVNNVLDLSRMEAGKMSTAADRFDLRGAVEEAMQATRVLLGRKPVAARAEISPETPRYVVGDAPRLHQVLLNLLGNAAKFTEVGEIVLRLAPSDELGVAGVAFEVSDTGPGMDAELRRRLFQPFAQSGAAGVRRHEGTGLGLAISKRLIELMGGVIRVDSTPGVGSTISVLLPFAAAASPEAGGTPHRIRTPGRSLRVLVAEDAPASQELMRAMLERRGHRAIVVGDGAQALAAIEADRFDVALLDIQMPELDGIETARRVRALPPPAGRTPLVALTAQAQESDRRRALAAGFDGFVTKPLQGGVLDDALARFGDRASERAKDAPDQASPDRDPVDREALGALTESIGADAVARLVGRFESDCLERLAAMRLAAANGDDEGVGLHAHTLVGLFDQYALPSLAAAARRLEDAARDGRSVDLGAVSELVSRAGEGVRSLRASVASARTS